jgi:hypothetical protein
MKTKGRLVHLSIIGAMSLMAAVAWGKTYTMQTSTLEPGAVAKLDVKANTGNTEMDLKVEHLAKPSLLSQPASNYVVWVQQPGHEPINEGLLRVDDSLKGEVKATTTAARFTVLVTAEDDAKAQTPSDRVVLRADVQE